MSETEIDIPHGIKKIFAGSPLLEVISVSVTPNDCPCRLHGGIWVLDGVGSVRIFNVDPEDSLTIDSSCPSRPLPLLNRRRAIFGDYDDELFVYLELKDEGGYAESVNGYYSLSGEHRNTLLVKEITGKFGSVSVSYFVHWAAVEANIWATLNQKSIPSDLNASLKVVARYMMCDMEHKNCDRWCERTIFEGEVSHDDKEDVYLGGCVLALPTYSNVAIDVSLRSDADGTELWGGEVVFDIQEINYRNVIDKDAGTQSCPIKLFAVSFDYSPCSVDTINNFKDGRCPEEVFLYRAPDDADDEDDDDEDGKRETSQAQEQNKVKE